MKQNFIDSMAIVQRFGKPDLFITLTCNPKWKEIIENLGKYEETIDRPDIVAKVFRQKLKEFLDEVVKKGIFGKCIAFTYVIEFQKRGLTHAFITFFRF